MSGIDNWRNADGRMADPTPTMDLRPVIAWLENGCDPKEAAKELRIYQATIRTLLDERDRLAGEMGVMRELLRRMEQATAIDTEHHRLRAAQSDSVMPMIGPLLDAWECCAQGVREEHPELDKHLRRINRAMEDAEGPNTLVSGPPADA